MDLSYMLLLHSYPCDDPRSPVACGGDDDAEDVDDDEPETVPENPAAPLEPQPSTPDANPIDPRVFNPVH